MRFVSFSAHKGNYQFQLTSDSAAALSLEFWLSNTSNPRDISKQLQLQCPEKVMTIHTHAHTNDMPYHIIRAIWLQLLQTIVQFPIWLRKFGEGGTAKLFKVGLVASCLHVSKPWWCPKLIQLHKFGRTRSRFYEDQWAKPEGRKRTGRHFDKVSVRGWSQRERSFLGEWQWVCCWCLFLSQPSLSGYSVAPRACEVLSYVLVCTCNARCHPNWSALWAFV